MFPSVIQQSFVFLIHGNRQLPGPALAKPHFYHPAVQNWQHRSRLGNIIGAPYARVLSRAVANNIWDLRKREGGSTREFFSAFLVYLLWGIRWGVSARMVLLPTLCTAWQEWLCIQWQRHSWFGNDPGLVDDRGPGGSRRAQGRDRHKCLPEYKLFCYLLPELLLWWKIPSKP